MAIINIRYVPEAMPTNKQKADIAYAAAQWTKILNDDLSINVQVWAVSMNIGLNTICIPGFYQGADQPTLTRPQAKLLGAIAGHDLNIDLIVVIDTATPWVLGTDPAPEVATGQYSLATTIMHELCHGLGFLGLCDAAPRALSSSLHGLGTYTAADRLIKLLNLAVKVMDPNVDIPEHFFPDPPKTGFAVRTPFANLFKYTTAKLAKGEPTNDYTAFMEDNGSIVINSSEYIVLTADGRQFRPFSTCDHITGADYLMNPSTEGQYYSAPDASSRDILRKIGWTVGDG